MTNQTVEWFKKNWFKVAMGFILCFALINFTLPWVYKTGCCTYNGNRSCDTNCSGGGGGDSGGGVQQTWDGECTREITDECCGDSFDVRMCGGQKVSRPEECYQYYCKTDGYYCGATYGITGQYVCGCTSVEVPR